MIDKASRYLYKNGNTYVQLPDPQAARERRERRGYSKGVTDGEKYAVWAPPTSFNTPLPTLDLATLSNQIDNDSYKKGFAAGFYKKL